MLGQFGFSPAPSTGGGGGSGTVTSVTAGDTTITVAGTATDPTVAVNTTNIPPSTRTLTAGAGLTGGGTLAADRTFTVGAGTGITVNADDVAINYANANTWTALQTFNIADAATNTVTDLLVGNHTSSGTAAAGYGAGILLRGQDASAGADDMASIRTLWSDATATSEDSALVFQVRTGGSALANAFHAVGTSLYGASKIGIGTVSATGVTTEVAGINVVSGFIRTDCSSGTVGGYRWTASPSSTAWISFSLEPAAKTGQTAGTAINGFQYLTYSRTWASNTAITAQREFVVNAPTYAFASATGTITDAATFYVSGAPIVGTNAAITNSYSAWFGAQTRHDGLVDLSNIAAGSPNIKITKTTDTPTTTFSAVNATNAAPSGFIEITEGGTSKYIPFYT